MDNQALLWLKNKNIDTVVVIGVQEGGIYKVPGKFLQDMVHYTIIQCEL